MSETQIMFERAVHHHLSCALYSSLENIDEFQIGAVLVYHKKPKFWRENELDFSSLPVKKLILKEDASSLAEIEKYTRVLFSATDNQSDANLHINMDVDADVKVAFVKLGGQLGGSAEKDISMKVSLGGIKHITSNMYDILTDKPLRVNPHHPVVQDALAKGKCFFVINSVYQSDKAEIKIDNQVDLGLSEGINLDTNATKSDVGSTNIATQAVDGAVGVAGTAVQTAVMSGISGKIEESMDFGSNSNSLTVTKRSIPTNIGFHIMKVDIGRNGTLVPQGKSGFDHHTKIYFPYGDTFVTHNKTSATTVPVFSKATQTTNANPVTISTNTTMVNDEN